MEDNQGNKIHEKWINICSSGFILSLIIFIVTLIQTDTVNKNDLLNKTFTLEFKPKYISATSPGARYFVSIKINDENYRISGANYKYLNHSKFKNDIHFLDTVNVSCIDNEIYLMSKN